MLGRAHEYLELLKEELLRRAMEINELHDRLLAVENEAAQLRLHVQELERQLRGSSSNDTERGG